MKSWNMILVSYSEKLIQSWAYVLIGTSMFTCLWSQCEYNKIFFFFCVIENIILVYHQKGWGLFCFCSYFSDQTIFLNILPVLSYAYYVWLQCKLIVSYFFNALLHDQPQGNVEEGFCLLLLRGCVRGVVAFSKVMAQRTRDPWGDHIFETHPVHHPPPLWNSTPRLLHMIYFVLTRQWLEQQFNIEDVKLWPTTTACPYKICKACTMQVFCPI